MSEPKDAPLEELLRQSLAAEAAHIRPTGDGLSLIRAQIEKKRRRWRWLRPVLTVTAAVAVVAVATSVPGLVTTSDERREGQIDAAGSPFSPPSGNTTPPAPPQSGAADEQPKASQDPLLPATPLPDDPTLTDMPTIFPYSSRAVGNKQADADVANGKHPYLLDPSQTALAFIQSFLGDQTKLTVADKYAFGDGFEVQVNRILPDHKEKPLTQVYLVPARTGPAAPWIVVGASRPVLSGDHDMLSIESVPTAYPGSVVVVTGNLRRLAGPIPQVHINMRGPDSTTVLASASAYLEQDPKLAGIHNWAGELRPEQQSDSPSATVAAWTVSPDGGINEFVATNTAPTS